MANNYTTKTAALKATKADINKLDAKKMLLNGKNILDYISDSEFNSYDTRDPQLKNDELDIWNTEISLSDNGHIEVKPQVHSVVDKEWDSSKEEYDFTFEGMTENQYNTLKTAVKVIDNEVLDDNDEHIMYWQTDGLTNSDSLLQSHYNYSYNKLALTTFSSGLSNLTDGRYTFEYSENLSEFETSSLNSLVTAYNMFGNTSITEFDCELPNLKYGHGMFNYCTNLESFSSDLTSLINGDGMFYGCSKLTSFTANLSSLQNGMGYGMFYSCKLDAKSVANIVHTLPQRDTKPTVTYGDGNIGIGIGCDNTEADKLLFAQECDCETWQELLAEFSAKNWNVRFDLNGRPTTTYNMRRGETLPVYTKLDEVADEKHAQYISADGSKFYIINCFHSTNGSTEGYDVFSSLEEAISTYNVTPKN